MRYVIKSLEFVLIAIGFVWAMNRGFEWMNAKDTLFAAAGLLLNVSLVVGVVAWLGHKIGQWGHDWHGPWHDRFQNVKDRYDRREFVWVLVISTLWLSGCTRVGPGYVGIKVSMAGTNRGVEDTPTTTGWVFYNPFGSSVLEYPIFEQNVVWTHDVNEGNPVNEEITFTNHDQMQIGVDVSLSYHIDPVKVPFFYVKFRNDDLTKFTLGYLRNTARDKFNDTAGRYTIEQIMGDNGPFLREVKTALQTDLTPIGVIIGQFGIIGAPRPPPSVLASINLKVQAVQIAQQKQNEVVQAEADARKAVAVADGEAKAILSVATAQAQANRLLNESLTGNLIQYKQLEKWNGVLPQVSGGATPFINLQK